MPLTAITAETMIDLFNCVSAVFSFPLYFSFFSLSFSSHLPLPAPAHSLNAENLAKSPYVID